jgi:hypothetical protein
MGKRQDNVLKYLSCDFDFSPVKLPTLKEYKASPYYQEIFEIYKELGGMLDEIPFGGLSERYIDFFINGRILELDEENHFNRYRLVTLAASIYANNQSFDTDKYIKYCEKFNNKCRQNGKFWRSNSSEQQFGVSAPEGIFDGNGSSRYKQRAFYDMLKDFIPHISDIALKRISIYDPITIEGQKDKEITIQKVLKKYRAKHQENFHLLIRQLLS